MEREALSVPREPLFIDSVLEISGQRYLEDIPISVGISLLVTDRAMKSDSNVDKRKVAALMAWRLDSNIFTIQRYFDYLPRGEESLKAPFSDNRLAAEYGNVFGVVLDLFKLLEGVQMADDIWVVTSRLDVYSELISKGYSRKEVILMKDELGREAEARLRKNYLRDFVRSQRKKGIYDRAIALRTNQSEKKINKISKSWLGLNVIQPHPGRLASHNRGQEKVERFIVLRRFGKNNQEIAVDLDIPIERVEEMAKIFLPTGEIERVKGKNLPESRANRHKAEAVLIGLPVNRSISLRKIYDNHPELNMGYETFVDKYNEILEEGKTPIPLTKDKFRAKKEAEAKKLVRVGKKGIPVTSLVIAAGIGVSKSVADDIRSNLEDRGTLTSRMEYETKQEIKFVSFIRTYKRRYPHRRLSLRRVSRHLSLPYKTTLRFYRKLKAEEEVPGNKARHNYPLS